MLNHLSKKIGLDLKYFVSSGFWIYLGKGIEVSKGLVMSILYAALLTKTGYGQFTYIIAVYELAKLFAVPGMDLSIIQAVSRGHDGIYFTGMMRKMRWSLISSIILIITGMSYYISGEQALSWVFIILACLLPCESISELFRAVLSAKKQFKKIAIIGSFFEISTAAILIFLVLKFPAPTLLVLAIMAMRILILSSYSVWGVKKIITNNIVEKASISFGEKSSIIRILSVAELYYDKIIIGLLLGFQDLAIYTIALIFADNIKNAIAPITSSFIPKLVGLKIVQQNKQILWHHLAKLFIPVIVVIIGYTVMIPTVLQYLYPAYASKATHLAQLYGVMLLAIPYILFESYFIAHKKLRSLVIMNLIPMFTLLVILPIFTLLWGITGAVISQIITQISRLISSGVVYERSVSSE